MEGRKSGGRSKEGEKLKKHGELKKNSAFA